MSLCAILYLSQVFTLGIIPKEAKIGKLANTKQEGPENVGLTSPLDSKVLEEIP